MPAIPSIDFHCHSHFSDGALSPQELLQLAKAREVQQLAITDHDTVGAYSPQLLAAAARRHHAGERLRNFLSVAASWHSRCRSESGFGGAGLCPCDDAASPSSPRSCAKDPRRAAAIGSRCHALPQVQALAGDGVIGRPHFAQHLVSTNQMPSMAAAFKRVLGSGKPGDIKANWPTLETAVGWITDAGGIAVIAHPMKYKMTLTKLRALLEAFVAAGGQGLEVLTGYQDAQRIDALADLAHRYDLYASAGSDFHRPGQPWAELGRVAALPDRCVLPVWTLWS